MCEKITSGTRKGSSFLPLVSLHLRHFPRNSTMNDQYTFGGKYRLEQEIANGGCGTVFLGVHTVAGKEVAIKLEAASSNQESKIYKSRQLQRRLLPT